MKRLLSSLHDRNFPTSTNTEAARAGTADDGFEPVHHRAHRVHSGWGRLSLLLGIQRGSIKIQAPNERRCLQRTGLL